MSSGKEPSGPQDRALISRRGVFALAGGVVATGLSLGSARVFLYERLRWGEDFFPGQAPDTTLEPGAWTTTDEAIRFAVLGDNGSGGRTQMAVARQMALSYRDAPYGLVLLAGDISYYGSIDDRWEEVFAEPYRALIDAGVNWELAIGNHEIDEKKSPYAVQEIQAQLRRFGKPGTYYRVRHGPLDLFVLDTSIPLKTGEGGAEQLAWLETELSGSDAAWKVALLHHPAFSSGEHGSEMRVREAVQPLFAEHGVDVAFTGHDHHYERTEPQDGVVWIVSGAGCKLSRVGRSDFTAHAESTLQFMLADVVGETMELRSITTDGTVIDQATLRARSAG
jgi:hypothetical protein